VIESDFSRASSFALALKHLPAIPAVAQRAIELLESEDTTTQQLAELIAHDPSITARVLRYANSAAFGARRQIRDLVSAIVILGFKSAGEVVIAASLVDWYGGQDEESQEMWRRSLKIAALASRLARRLYAGRGAQATFIAGLMHDIGRATLKSSQPHLYATLRTSDRSNNELWVNELGFSAGDLSAALIHSWSLAEEVEITAHYCDAPAPFADVQGEAAVVLALVVTAIVLVDGERLDDNEIAVLFAQRTQGQPIGLPLRRAFLQTRHELQLAARSTAA